jgi:hypothetical protein
VCGGDKVTIIRREYFPVRKQVKLTEQLIINGTALPYAYSFDGAADITVRATATAALFQVMALLTVKKLL